MKTKNHRDMLYQNEKPFTHHSWKRTIFVFIFVVCAIGASSGISYIPLSSLLNKENPLLTVVLSAMAGFMLFGIIVMLINFIFRKSKENDLREEHNNLLTAMQEISRGNFDVLIKPDPNAPHQEIAAAFNQMTRDLGSLEIMRQDFISNVSHEIQSPLTSMNGFATLLQKDDLTDKERQHYAAIIQTESKRLSSLSDNLLKLSTLDKTKATLTLQDFRLDKQLEQIALTLEPQWSSKNLTVEADLQKVTIKGDQDLLSQVWMNLLHNAIKFTPNGGQINISLVADKETAIVKIADTGIGIAPEAHIHIFERFYKVDKARERSLGGSGLGLSIVREIIDLHDGSITVKSVIEKGTMFTLRLNSI